MIFNEKVNWNDIEQVKAELKKDGTNLCYVRNKTEELCRIAVESCPDALREVDNVTEELFAIAFLQSPSIAIMHAPDNIVMKVMIKLAPHIKELYKL